MDKQPNVLDMYRAQFNAWEDPYLMLDKTIPVEISARYMPNNKAEITGANAKQFGGNHYKTKGIQPWDYITSNNMGFLEGCIIKYVSRYQDKGGVEDLKKAMHFLEKLIEVKTNAT